MPPPRAPKAPRFLVVDTHPIQYRAPVFRKLAELSAGFEVCFLSEQFHGAKWWFHEKGKAVSHDWQVELCTGYPNSFLHTEKHNFRGKYQTLKKMLDEKKPDVVTIYGWFLPEHWILWSLCRARKIPLLFIGETFQRGSGWRANVKRVLHPIFFSGVTRVLSIGNKNTEFYRSLQIAEEKIIKAKYCVDTQFFEMSPADHTSTRAAVREKLGIPQKAFIALFVGRLFDRKRPLDMISLHKRMLKETRFHTVIAGSGELENELRSQSSKWKRFHVLGFQTQAEVRDLYHAADILLVPSEYETWGLVVNEAFACGLPAAVTLTCGAADDLVENGITGFVFPVGEVGTIAIQLRTLLENPSLLEALSRNAKDRVRSHYTVEQFAASLSQAFSEAALIGA